MTEDTEYERGPAAQRIEQARERAGVPATQLARDLDITEESYDDLERYDDEVFVCISVDQVCRLGELLRVDVQELLALRPTERFTPVPMSRLVSGISDEIRRRKESLEVFEDRVGWGGLASILENPDAAWSAWNLDALQDVCRAIGVNWRAVLASWPGRRQ